jgi:aryl-alcohol dehydrogenase-like predicted oxidoreductase
MTIKTGFPRPSASLILSPCMLTFDKLSRLGIGTYLGREVAAEDEMYIESIAAAGVAGLNVIDTAINYRRQCSERMIQRAILTMKQKGILRDQLFISTKGGYIPGDARAKDTMQDLLMEGLLRRGIMKTEEIVGEVHCMGGAYLRHQIETSLRNLGIPKIDLYYVHNPEEQLTSVDRATFESRLREAFAALETAVADGKIANYGVATWGGFRVPANDPTHLDLARICAIAKEVGGDGHHFAAIQAPYNASMTELRDSKNQSGRSVLDAAADFGLRVFVSGPLYQGKLAKGGPVPGFEGSPAQSALRFALAVPGVTTVLVGCKTLAHLEENLKVLN